MWKIQTYSTGAWITCEESLTSSDRVAWQYFDNLVETGSHSSLRLVDPTGLITDVWNYSNNHHENHAARSYSMARDTPTEFKVFGRVRMGAFILIREAHPSLSEANNYLNQLLSERDRWSFQIRCRGVVVRQAYADCEPIDGPAFVREIYTIPAARYPQPPQPAATPTPALADATNVYIRWCTSVNGIHNRGNYWDVFDGPESIRRPAYTAGNTLHDKFNRIQDVCRIHPRASEVFWLVIPSSSVDIPDQVIYGPVYPAETRAPQLREEFGPADTRTWNDLCRDLIQDPSAYEQLVPPGTTPTPASILPTTLSPNWKTMPPTTMPTTTEQDPTHAPLVSVNIKRGEGSALTLYIDATELHAMLTRIGVPSDERGFLDKPGAAYGVSSPDFKLSTDVLLRKQYPARIKLSEVFSTPPSYTQLKRLAESSTDAIRRILEHYQPIDISINISKKLVNP